MHIAKNPELEEGLIRRRRRRVFDGEKGKVAPALN
jgi:hypothetical protein